MYSYSFKSKALKYCLPAFFVFAVMIGCANTKPFVQVDAAENSLQGESEYFLQIGDVLDIKFFYQPELNETVTIRPDAKISLQLIDEVEAAGLTPVELKDILAEKYTSHIRQPVVAVIVKQFAGMRIYVGGEVNSPGVYPIVGKLTTIQAIMHANGLKNSAETENVVIIRGQGHGTPRFITVNLSETLKKEDQKYTDTQLKPNDIVFVPKTTIAKMDQFVDEYIDKLIPISRSIGVNFGWNLNPESKVEVIQK